MNGSTHQGDHGDQPWRNGYHNMTNETATFTDNNCIHDRPVEQSLDEVTNVPQQPIGFVPTPDELAVLVKHWVIQAIDDKYCIFWGQCFSVSDLDQSRVDDYQSNRQRESGAGKERVNSNNESITEVRMWKGGPLREMAASRVSNAFIPYAKQDAEARIDVYCSSKNGVVGGLLAKKWWVPEPYAFRVLSFVHNLL